MFASGYACSNRTLFAYLECDSISLISLVPILRYFSLPMGHRYFHIFTLVPANTGSPIQFEIILLEETGLEKVCDRS